MVTSIYASYFQKGISLIFMTIIQHFRTVGVDTLRIVKLALLIIPKLIQFVNQSVV